MWLIHSSIAMNWFEGQFLEKPAFYIILYGLSSKWLGP